MSAPTLRPPDFAPRVAHANYFTPRVAEWARRRIPDFEYVFVVSGRYRYEAAGRDPLDVATGEILLIPPEEEHRLFRTDPAAHSVISCMHFEFLAGASYAAGDYRLAVPFRRVTPAVELPVFLGLFKRAADTVGADHPYARILADNICREICIRLAALWEGAAPRALSPRLEAMLAFLRERLAEPVGRADLAAAFHITPEHVNAVFRNELGASPTRFVHRERVHRAYRLLQEEGLSVKEAAARVGFADPFHFSRVFKRIAGISPSRVAGRPLGRRR